ncbi:DUF4817 domain-containing protein [Trichonephila clavipes]|nr:DUF4817 domain-containing protein [Trichonephila clavipes]
MFLQEIETSDLRKRFRIEYLGQLREQTQHRRKLRPLTVGEVVVVENSLKNRTLWSLARVIQLIPGKDGHVRVARVKTETGELIRPVQRLYNLELQEPEITLPKDLTDSVIRTRRGRKVSKLLKRFEKTGKLEDRARAGRPCLKEARAPCIAVEMKAIASEAASGTSSAREAARRLGLPPSSVRNIQSINQSSCTHTNCNRAMNFCQQIPHRGKHLRSGPSLKWNRILPGFLTSCGQMKLISRFMVTLTTITVAFGRPLIHCPVNGWITKTVNAQRYLKLLRETVVSCLMQRGQISNVTFMQDGATSHTANPVKAFLIQTFGEDRIVSRRCRYPWPPRSPDLTPADFWL